MDSTVVVLLSVLALALGAALIVAIRLLLSIRYALAALPTAQISTGVTSVQSEQARVAQELGKAANALSVLQGAQQNLDAAMQTLVGQANARADADAQSRELLRRLELVIAGSFHRGAAGENLLAEVLGILPAGMLERNVRVAGGVVEFAVRLPGGKYIPIDSKWPALHLLESITNEPDVTRRAKLVRELEDQVSMKADEVAQYLDPEHTILLGVAAVPDAVYHLCKSAHAQAYRRGVVLLPYSLAVPYALSLIVLIARFGGALDTSQVRASIAKVDQTLHELEEAIESHMSRGLTMFANAVQNQRSGIAECRSIVASLRAREDSASMSPAISPGAGAPPIVPADPTGVPLAG